MNTRVVFAAVVIVLAVGFVSLSGCYTVLKHPAQVAMTDEQGERRSCSDCHDQAYYYHDPYMYRYFDHYSYADRWYGYYYDPWWYDDYWYYDSWDGQGPALESGGRTRWGSEPERATPPTRGATTAVGTTPSTEPKTEPNAAPPASQSTTDKNQRTRWGNEPARATPPQKAEEPKKNEEPKKPKEKKADDPNG